MHLLGLRIQRQAELRRGSWAAFLANAVRDARIERDNRGTANADPVRWADRDP